MANLFNPKKNASLLREHEELLFQEYYSSETTPSRKDFIRNQVIMSNTGFVIKNARYFAQKSPTFYEDFISAGFEGLLLAFDKFDPAKGYRFLSYAGFWVRERILKCMSQFRLVTVPVVNQQIQSKIAKLRKEGLTERETLEAFKPHQRSLALKMMENSYKTYYLDDEEELGMEHGGVNLDGPDAEKAFRILNELPQDLQTEMEKFLEGENSDLDKVEAALIMLREKMELAEES